MRKKSRKKSGKWNCPGIVSGLSAEYVFPDDDDHEEVCSLQTIDEDDDEGDLDDNSNPLDDDLGEDLEHSHHPQEKLQLNLPPSPEQALDEFPKLLEHPATASMLLPDSPLRSPLQPQLEEGQTSRMTMDGMRLPENELPSISSPRGPSDKYEQETTDKEGIPPDVHRDLGQPYQAHDDDHLVLHQVNSHDIPLETAASCSDLENHMLEDDSHCSPRQSPPIMNIIDAPKETTSLHPDGFQPVGRVLSV
ncbi:hypothetical protein Dimus_003599 [Dionaea muscipula]